MMMVRCRMGVLLALAAIAAGCQGTTTPERRELLGSWQSDNVPGVTVRMTLAETARSVDGAGAWTDATTSVAFRVSGAIARDEVSLFFDFQTRDAINFQGYFANGDRLEGRLSGAGYQEQAVTFTRIDLHPT